MDTQHKYTLSSIMAGLHCSIQCLLHAVRHLGGWGWACKVLVILHVDIMVANNNRFQLTLPTGLCIFILYMHV